jgi:hypothetical protein
MYPVQPFAAHSELTRILAEEWRAKTAIRLRCSAIHEPQLSSAGLPASAVRLEGARFIVDGTVSPDLTVRELADWAKMQAERLRRGLPDDAGGYPAFVIAQAAKLAEEVGELQAEVLGHAGYQRRSKSKGFTTDTPR